MTIILILHGFKLPDCDIPKSRTNLILWPFHEYSMDFSFLIEPKSRSILILSISILSSLLSQYPRHPRHPSYPKELCGIGVLSPFFGVFSVSHRSPFGFPCNDQAQSSQWAPQWAPQRTSWKNLTYTHPRTPIQNSSFLTINESWGCQKKKLVFIQAFHLPTAPLRCYTYF